MWPAKTTDCLRMITYVTLRAKADERLPLYLGALHLMTTVYNGSFYEISCLLLVDRRAYISGCRESKCIIRLIVCGSRLNH
jgi:hypothetical protein